MEGYAKFAIDDYKLLYLDLFSKYVILNPNICSGTLGGGLDIGTLQAKFLRGKTIDDIEISDARLMTIQDFNVASNSISRYGLDDQTSMEAYEFLMMQDEPMLLGTYVLPKKLKSGRILCKVYENGKTIAQDAGIPYRKGYLKINLQGIHDNIHTVSLSDKLIYESINPSFENIQEEDLFLWNGMNINNLSHPVAVIVQPNKGNFIFDATQKLTEYNEKFVIPLLIEGRPVAYANYDFAEEFR